MFDCKICSFSGKSNNSLSAHIYQNHSLKRKEYYDMYLKKDNEGICPICSKETSFRGNNYLKFCSIKCSHSSDEWRLKNSNAKKGKKQSKEIVEKRINNTDQKKKQETREKTLLKRYNNKHYNNSEQISISNKGKRKGPRPKEWSDNVIASKRKNNTLKHREEIKVKIGKSIKALHQTDDAPVTISKSKYMGRNHLTGYYNNIYYRSSYELKFLEYCFENNIKVEPADLKSFRIKYKDETGKFRFYYPDFYLPDLDIVVEVKPLSMLDQERTIAKMHEAMMNYNYVLITEDELENLNKVFQYF